MMRIFYSIAVFFYRCAITLASLFNKKANLWHQGRVHLFETLQKKCKGKDHIVWFHCASLGEFEQGKPLMQKIKTENPEQTILVSFFSPSGYEIKKKDNVADIITYLPIDSKSNAQRFVEIVKPEMVFFVKYEFWFNLMDCLYQRNIPFYYISAIFRPSQYFFKRYGFWFAKQLKKCSYFFVQNQISEELLQSIGIKQVEITGDTRFDRVNSIAHESYQLDFMIRFREDKKLIVAGSTWEPDELLLKDLFPTIAGNYKIVIAPHLIDKEHIKNIKEKFVSYKVLCYSEITDQDLSSYQILIIDTIGLLSKLYKYSYLSYIGGAFETGLHNILEAAVFGVPLFFGPHYAKFNEAVSLVNLQGAFSICGYNELLDKIKLYHDHPEAYQQVCEICRHFVHANLGACDKIWNKIKH